jgi:hypothetical protein
VERDERGDRVAVRRAARARRPAGGRPRCGARPRCAAREGSSWPGSRRGHGSWWAGYRAVVSGTRCPPVARRGGPSSRYASAAGPRAPPTPSAGQATTCGCSRRRPPAGSPGSGRRGWTRATAHRAGRSTARPAYSLVVVSPRPTGRRAGGARRDGGWRAACPAFCRPGEHAGHHGERRGGGWLGVLVAALCALGGCTRRPATEHLAGDPAGRPPAPTPDRTGTRAARDRARSTSRSSRRPSGLPSRGGPRDAADRATPRNRPGLAGRSTCSRLPRQPRGAGPSRTDVAALTKDAGVIVAMPFGGLGGFYSDWVDRPKVGDLPHGRAPGRPRCGIPTRRARAAVAGLSMGGLGGPHVCGPRHPGPVAAAASFSEVVTHPAVGRRRVPATRVLVESTGADPNALWGDPDADADVVGGAQPVRPRADAQGASPLFISCGDGTAGPLDSPQPASLTATRARWPSRTSSSSQAPRRARRAGGPGRPLRGRHPLVAVLAARAAPAPGRMIAQRSGSLH